MFRCVVCLFLLNIHIIIELILNIRSLRSRENTLSFYITLIRYLHLSDNVPCFPYITFVFKFLLGIVVVPGEIEDNAQLKQFFWGGGGRGRGGEQGTLWRCANREYLLPYQKPVESCTLQIYGVLFLKMNEDPCDRKSGGGLGIYVKRYL